MKRFRKKFPKQPTSKFKSKLEEDFNNFLIKQKIKFGYEDYKVSYLKPEKLSKYTPDFNCPAIDTFKIIFETKGQFLTSDRKKHLLIKAQHPKLDIRFVFSNSKTKIGKNQKQLMQNGVSSRALNIIVYIQQENFYQMTGLKKF